MADDDVRDEVRLLLDLLQRLHDLQPREHRVHHRLAGARLLREILRLLRRGLVEHELHAPERRARHVLLGEEEHPVLGIFREILREIEELPREIRVDEEDIQDATFFLT